MRAGHLEPSAALRRSWPQEGGEIDERHGRRRAALPRTAPARTPAAIRAELVEELRAEFDREYVAALEDAKASYHLDRLNEVIGSWWLTVWARRSPRRDAAIETGMRLLRGEPVGTIRPPTRVGGRVQPRG